MIILRLTRVFYLGRLASKATGTPSYLAPGSTTLSKPFMNDVTLRQLSQLHSKPWLFKPHNQVPSRSNSTSCKTIQPFILPDIGEGIKEVTVKGWLVKLGDSVKEFDEICEVESDKATATITSRYEGTITKIYHDTGAIAMVGQPLVDIELSQEPESAPCVNPVTTQEDNQAGSRKPNENNGQFKGNSQEVPLTLPSVRKLAKENHLDLTLVTATGRNGTILKEDVLAYLNRKTSASTSQPVSVPKRETNQERETVIPLQGIQRAMFKNMTKSLRIPHFNYSDEIDMTRLVGATRLVKLVDKDGIETERKVGQLPFIIKMISLALTEFPQLNAVVDESGSHLRQKNYHNIGVAVDTKTGLIVPNIKDVQSLSILQIDSELTRLRQLAYQSKLSTADLSGGTVTLSNIGAIGGVFGVPVLMDPEIVIGALGRIRALPRFNSSGELEKRHIVQVVWSADHRVVDGATLSRFSNLFKQFLEQPEAALLRLV